MVVSHTCGVSFWHVHGMGVEIVDFVCLFGAEEKMAMMEEMKEPNNAF